jgi:DNA polymerase-3 subunit delta'
MKSPLIGNGRVWNIVSAMISNQKIPHAIIIEGDIGLGKKTLAKFLAKACLCAEKLPCLSCKSCHLIDVGTHPDCQIIEPEKNAIKVDEIRNLRLEAFMSPLFSDGRVFIINDAHTMNTNAQNALLKVLEEPPKNVTFILLAKSGSMLLETIRSRCVSLTLAPVPLEEEGAELISKERSISFDEAYKLLIRTDGNIGQAINFSENDSNSYSSVAQEILNLSVNNERLKILLMLQPYSKDRTAIFEIVSELKNIISKEFKKKAVKEISSFTASKLNYIYYELLNIESKLEFNPPVTLLISRITAVLTD